MISNIKDERLYDFIKYIVELAKNRYTSFGKITNDAYNQGLIDVLFHVDKYYYSSLNQNLNKKLINALIEERNNFREAGYKTYDHDVTILYLRTGKLIKQFEQVELLYMCIYNYRTLLEAYGCIT